MQPSLGFVNTLIEWNWAAQNLIHLQLSTMIVSNCTMLDNYAQFVTHGVTLIYSHLEVE